MTTLQLQHKAEFPAVVISHMKHDGYIFWKTIESIVINNILEFMPEVNKND